MSSLLSRITGALGGGAHVVSGVSSLTLLIGLVYFVDCRLQAKGADAVDRCYFTALPLAGIGAAGRGAFHIGYNTLNPALRPENSEPVRDSHGRFTRREG